LITEEPSCAPWIDDYDEDADFLAADAGESNALLSFAALESHDDGLCRAMQPAAGFSERDAAQPRVDEYTLVVLSGRHLLRCATPEGADKRQTMSRVLLQF
jgi:hypothetical protein